MSNDFYNHGNYPATRAPGASASARAEFDSIEAGFEKLAPLTGGAFVVVNAGGTAQEAVAPVAALALMDGANASDVQNSSYTYLVGAAGTNTITAGTSPALTAYAVGQKFHFLMPATNTGPATLNVDGLGAKSLTFGSTALNGAELPIGSAIEVVYDGTKFQILSVSNQPYPQKNIIVNSGFAVDQLYFSALAGYPDDTYIKEVWYALTQSSTIGAALLSAQESGTPSNMRLTQTNASAQRFGMAQIIESADSLFTAGEVIGFRARVRASNSQAIRYAILGWTGTADAVTSDVVNDWSSSSYTAGGFFLGTNLSVVAVGSLTPAAATWTDLPLISGTVGSTVKNLIVMIWVEGSAAQNFTLDIARCWMGKGYGQWIPEPYEVELARCKRLYEVIGNSSAASLLGAGYAETTTSARASMSFFEKRVAPSITFGGDPDIIKAGADLAGSSATAAVISTKTAQVRVTPSAGSLVAGESLLLQYTTSGYVILDARL